MRASKLTTEQRRELILLKRAGNLDEMKARALQLGVSRYYGSILERRQRHPYERSRRAWARARQAGPVLA